MAKLLLEEMLKKRKVSKYRFAILLGIDHKNVRRLFLPGFDPKLSFLARAAKALKCRIRDLYKE